MKESKIYILLTDTGSFLTKLIKLYTNKPYNHASIALDSNLEEVYSFGRKNIHNPLNGGFVQEDVNSKLLNHARCAIYSLTVTDNQLQTIKNYIEEISAEKDAYHYNFLGLFGFVFNRPLTRKNSYFCSEFVASVLEGSNVIQFENSVSLVAPHDLQELPDLRLEYEGSVNDYLMKGEPENVSFSYPFIPA
ncbi:hypothetical protein [Ornithinibacillus halotolerans]|uniref:Permuted papain-like amidase YaeF/Yiix C92 family enzyme n=1 Tax=Ornithinibacillus halotolerans TaxID=1274357 RepID=A0A916S133_9BACI|nr:hypothetical protein [Ornithinibacillus halotolerans]GGA78604.1 hypothetical protein GCM10008025_22610 [Ornithinibacillus halotolerans]